MAGMLDQMPDSMVGELIGGWDPSMLGSLGDIGGGFDPNAWISDAGATDFLPPDFDFGRLPDMPGGTPGGMPGDPTGSMPIPNIPPIGVPTVPPPPLPMM